MLIKDCCFKMNFILVVVVVAFLIQQPALLFIEATNTDLLSRIHQNKNRMQQSRALSFLQHVEGFDSNAVCPSFLRSDVQVRLNSFQTIVSSCSDGFSECRLAMSARGHIYGTTNPEFNTFLSLIEVDTQRWINNRELLGAHYIKFVASQKYLCVNRKLKLYSSSTEQDECLWKTGRKPIFSAVYRRIKLVVKMSDRRCNVAVNVERSPYSQSINKDENSCERYQIERAYAPELSTLEKQCVKVINRPSQQQNQNIYRLDDQDMALAEKQNFRRSDRSNSNAQLCQDYLINDKFNKLIKSDRIYSTCLKYINNLTSRVETSSKNIKLTRLIFDLESQDSIQLDEQRFLTTTTSSSLESKKCLPHRNTPFYKLCLLKNYKCYKYREDPVRLKNCRKLFEIEVPQRIEY